jgi:GNAT superfamily N-acetyltransferase
MWILEYDGLFVGLIGLDAAPPSNASTKTPNTRNRSRIASVTAERAEIRHFYVEEPYRKTNVQDDLLQHALTQAFENGNVKTVGAVASGLQSYISKSLVRAGFKYEDVVKKVGTLGWKIENMVLAREDWERRQGEKKD